ncbi:hypothetical protein GCM10022227_26500 [Streptomyces sedi]
MTNSGRVQESSMAMPCRTLRYSGNERPAWRMNHTGVCGTGSRRHAFRNTESVTVTEEVSHGTRLGPLPRVWLPAADRSGA